MTVPARSATAAVAVPASSLSRHTSPRPGWGLRALAAHLGGVHRWARSALTRPRPGEQSDEGPEPGVDLRAWFDEGAHDLVRTLRGTDPATECWTFGPGPARPRSGS